MSRNSYKNSKILCHLSSSKLQHWFWLVHLIYNLSFSLKVLMNMLIWNAPISDFHPCNRPKNGLKCENGGTCHTSEDGVCFAYCICPDGFYGEKCQNSKCQNVFLLLKIQLLILELMSDRKMQFLRFICFNAHMALVST